MRICLFTPTFLPLLGGAERMADTLARGLMDRGHAVRVLTQRVDDHSPTMPELPYEVEHYRRLPAQHLWPEALSWRLGRLHRDWPFDVVLAFYAYPCGYAAVHWKRSHVRRHRGKLPGGGVVVTPRGADLYPRFHALRKPRVRSVIAAGYAGADRIVSISDWLTRRIVEVTGKPREQLPPIDQVPNGLDLAAFDAELAHADRGTLPPPPELSEGRFLLHMGRVEPVKQPELAVRAVAQCAQVFRQHGVTYALVGDGASLASVRSLILELNVGDIVLALGRRTGRERAWLLKHARGFVSTSREEGMPNAILEAMAAGLPAVASDIGPHRELLRAPAAQAAGALPEASPAWGLLFQSDNPHDLALKLQQLLATDPAPWRDAALRLRDHYTLARTLDGYERSLTLALDPSHG